MNKSLRLKGAIVGLVLTFFSACSYAATMVLQQNYYLLGITEVNVSGYGLYDVTFSNTWQGETYSQPFSIAATNALLALFSPGGQFDQNYRDSHPALTEGCESLASCQWLTPYEVVTTSSVTVHGPAFVNLDSTSTDYINNSLYVYPNTDYSTINHASWVPSVPIPAAVTMFAPGLLSLLGFARKNRRC